MLPLIEKCINNENLNTQSTLVASFFISAVFAGLKFIKAPFV